MAGYRHRLVHFYAEVSGTELCGSQTQRRKDLVNVLEALEEWVARHPEKVDETL